MEPLNYELDNCPVCNAKLRTQSICRRCKADLGPLMNMKSRAAHHMDQAIFAYEKSRFQDMFFHARRSHTLNATPGSTKILACASLLVHKFDLAVFLWKKKLHN
jgi:hypothetical protein